MHNILYMYNLTKNLMKKCAGYVLPWLKRSKNDIHQIFLKAKN